MSLLDDLFRGGRPLPGQGPMTADRVLARAVFSLPGARMIADHAVVDVDGDEVPLEAHEARGRFTLTSPTIDTGGALLAIRGTVRVPFPRTAEVLREIAERLGVDHLEIGDGGDPGLAAAWIDPELRDELPQLFWVSRTSAGCAAVMIGDGRVVARPLSTAEDHLAAVARVVSLLATRPRRLARELANAAAPLGGRATGPTWGLDGDFALLFPRGDRELVVDFTRTVPGQRRVQLCTRARMSARITPDELGSRLRTHAPLARKVSASSFAVVGDEVVIAVDGIPEDLAPLVELGARLAGEPASTGPYR